MPICSKFNKLFNKKVYESNTWKINNFGFGKLNKKLLKSVCSILLYSNNTYLLLLFVL